MLRFDPIDASIGASEIYRTGRKIGITIRKSNDCLIAWHAIEALIPVLSSDWDFEKIRQFTSLKTY